MIEDNQNRITQALANNDKEVFLTVEYVYQLQQENQQLKSQLSESFIESEINTNNRLEKENRELSEQLQQRDEAIEKAIIHLDIFISDTNLSKYDTLKILMYTKKILKEIRVDETK